MMPLAATALTVRSRTAEPTRRPGNALDTATSDDSERRPHGQEERPAATLRPKQSVRPGFR